MSMRSVRAVQHRQQPLLISMIFSSPPSTSALSMGISPNSFSMTAMRCPWLAVRMWFTSVVLPEPRKAVSTVTGILLAVLMSGSYRSIGASSF